MDRNDVLTFVSHFRKWAYEDEENEALTELEDAYSKTEPIKPILDTGVGVDVVWCGKCGMNIDEIQKRGDRWVCLSHIGAIPDEDYVYCPYCGQKINWNILNEA